MLREERDGAVAVWTLDRPATKNALDAATLGALNAAMDAAADDPGVRAAILTGAGGDFASGGDLRELRGRHSPDDAAALSDAGEHVCRRLGELPFPVVAVVCGVAFGGGAELALACDLRVADETARISFKQARMGVTTAWGLLPRLVALVGPSAAARLLYTAAEVAGAEARTLGLVDLCTAPGEAMVTALAWCAEIAAGAPDAVRETKALLRAAGQALYAAVRPLEREAFVRTWSSPDHVEAVEAYFARRKPAWRRE